MKTPDNPFAPPVSELEMESTEPWYHWPIPALTLSSCWKQSDNLLQFAILCCLRIFRVPIDPLFAISIRTRPIGKSDIPPEFVGRIEPFLLDAQACEFQNPEWFQVPTIGSGSIRALAMLSPDGRSVFTASVAELCSPKGTVYDTRYAVQSFLPDGSVVITSGSEEQTGYTPKRMILSTYAGSDVATLVERHTSRLHSFDGIEIVPSPTQLCEKIVSSHRLVGEDAIAAGQLVRAKASVVDRLRASSLNTESDNLRTLTGWLALVGLSLVTLAVLFGFTSLREIAMAVTLMGVVFMLSAVAVGVVNQRNRQVKPLQHPRHT